MQRIEKLGPMNLDSWARSSVIVQQRSNVDQIQHACKHQAMCLKQLLNMMSPFVLCVLCCSSLTTPAANSTPREKKT